MKRHRVWIVEMLSSDPELPPSCRGWSTTVGIGLNREAGRLALKHWKEGNSYDKFRLRSYAAPDTEGKK